MTDMADCTHTHHVWKKHTIHLRQLSQAREHWRPQALRHGARFGIWLQMRILVQEHWLLALRWLCALGGAQQRQHVIGE